MFLIVIFITNGILKKQQLDNIDKNTTNGRWSENMEIFARNLKVGDKVNCHERGWLTVKEIKKQWVIYVTYDNGTETYYSKEDRLFVIR